MSESNIDMDYLYWNSAGCIELWCHRSNEAFPTDVSVHLVLRVLTWGRRTKDFALLKTENYLDLVHSRNSHFSGC